MVALTEEQLEQIRAACVKYGVQRLWLFGSAATGQFDPAKSDYDFLVEFGRVETMHRGKQYFGLQFFLEDLFLRNADLVELIAIANKHFQKSVESERVELYAA